MTTSAAIRRKRGEPRAPDVRLRGGGAWTRTRLRGGCLRWRGAAPWRPRALAGRRARLTWRHGSSTVRRSAVAAAARAVGAGAARGPGRRRRDRRPARGAVAASRPGGVGAGAAARWVDGASRARPAPAVARRGGAQPVSLGRRCWRRRPASGVRPSSRRSARPPSTRLDVAELLERIGVDDRRADVVVDRTGRGELVAATASGVDADEVARSPRRHAQRAAPRQAHGRAQLGALASAARRTVRVASATARSRRSMRSWRSASWVWNTGRAEQPDEQCRPRQQATDPAGARGRRRGTTARAGLGRSAVAGRRRVRMRAYPSASARGRSGHAVGHQRSVRRRCAIGRSSRRPAGGPTRHGGCVACSAALGRLGTPRTRRTVCTAPHTHGRSGGQSHAAGRPGGSAP